MSKFKKTKIKNEERDEMKLKIDQVLAHLEQFSKTENFSSFFTKDETEQVIKLLQRFLNYKFYNIVSDGNIIGRLK